MLFDPMASSRIFTVTPALGAFRQRFGKGASDLPFPVNVRLDGDRRLRRGDSRSIAG